jgi:hypothetical protein
LYHGSKLLSHSAIDFACVDSVESKEDFQLTPEGHMNSVEHILVPGLEFIAEGVE